MKLAGREMAAEDVMAGLLRSLERMNEALRGARETRPEGDGETEEELLSARALGQEMEQEIRRITEERRRETGTPDSLIRHSLHRVFHFQMTAI